MNSFSKRFAVFAFAIVAFSSVTLVLSQSVRYKPWGVPGNRRDDYDDRLSELDQQAELRTKYLNMPKPTAKILSPYHDFGWVSPGESLEHTFVIQNIGDDDLSLRIHQTSDAGLAANLEHTSISPGEKTRCTVKMIVDDVVTDHRTTQSKLTHSVTIATNDPLRSTLVVHLQSQLKFELVLPAKIDFGNHDITDASTVSFILYSQQNRDLKIKDLTNDSIGIEWIAEPIDLPIDDLAGKSATAAIRLTLKATPRGYGRYSDSFSLSAELDGGVKEFTIDFSGRVRPPIGFYGPHVDKRTGIDFGTRESGKRHDLFMVVRSRGDHTRPIEVLDIKPKMLETELQPLETEGNYRLRISVPKDCPSLRFNLAEQHGFIQVGDPLSKSYSNWMPIYGVVANTKAN